MALPEASSWDAGRRLPARGAPEEGAPWGGASGTKRCLCSSALRGRGRPPWGGAYGCGTQAPGRDGGSIRNTMLKLHNFAKITAYKVSRLSAGFQRNEPLSRGRGAWARRSRSVLGVPVLGVTVSTRRRLARCPGARRRRPAGRRRRRSGSACRAAGAAASRGTRGRALGTPWAALGGERGPETARPPGTPARAAPTRQSMPRPLTAPPTPTHAHQ